MGFCLCLQLGFYNIAGFQVCGCRGSEEELGDAEVPADFGKSLCSASTQND